MLRSFVTITLLFLILTSVQGASAEEIWQTPLLVPGEYDLLYGPVKKIFYTGTATTLQSNNPASLRHLNGAMGEPIEN
eukprot:scaffold221341_cov32-Attheya_sp.AAC.2